MCDRIVSPGKPVYGHSVGILMQRDSIVRLPGDVGNATTFGFPVRYCLVEGVGGNDLKDPDSLQRIVPSFIRSAKQLENEGARMLAAGCGFASMLQPMLADAVKIPVLTSSLIQVPLVSASIARRPVGIITANSRVLDDRYFLPVGWSTSTIDVRIWGIEHETELLDILRYGGGSVSDLLKRGNDVMARVTQNMMAQHHDIAAIVLECTNLGPFASAVSSASGVPVFDITTLIRWGHTAAVREDFMGFC